MNHTLEIGWHGMTPCPDDADTWVSAGRRDEISHVDVELRIIFPDTGEIEVLLEKDNLTISEADTLFGILETLFPKADVNISPE